MNEKNSPTKEFVLKHRGILVSLLLMLATLTVYWQVYNFRFINFDDNKYIYENRHVQGGLTLESIAWAFSSTDESNWHPLTWLSHIIDVQLFGMNPGWHHLTNLFLHMTNTCLLFFVFRLMTGGFWRSAFVAALFALHPLHVESVAWVSERKDMLSTFFWMLTMWSYIRYVERPAVHRYIVVVFFFVLGLMSKPMLVTLPFVLLLLDIWPLGRIKCQPVAGSTDDQPVVTLLHLILEKIPLFILLSISSVVTIYAQKQGGSVASFGALPLKARLFNALLSYVTYIGKMIYPNKLAAYYPHPEILAWWKVIGACLLLASISFLTIRVIKQRPYFAVGWLWYIGTLVPVIGIVQVGRQSMADRYTYVPLIGLFIMISWGVSDLLSRWPSAKIWAAISAVLLIPCLMIASWTQAKYWENSVTLFERAINVTSDNFVAHNNLGKALADQGLAEKAIDHFLKALQIKPDSTETHINLGAALSKQGKIEKAIGHYAQALRINPDSLEAHYNLGLAFNQTGQINKAIDHYRQALRIKPDFENVYNSLGIALYRKGDIEQAIVHFRKALEINPEYVLAKENLGKILKLQSQGQ